MEMRPNATLQYPFFNDKGYIPTLNDTDTDRLNTKNSMRHSTQEESGSNKAIKDRLKLFESNFISSNQSDRQVLDHDQPIIKSVSSQYHQSLKKKNRLFESVQKQRGNGFQKQQKEKKSCRRNKIFEDNYHFKINNLHRIRTYESLQVDDSSRIQVGSKQLRQKFRNFTPATQHFHKPIFVTSNHDFKGGAHLNFIDTIPVVPKPQKLQNLPKIDETHNCPNLYPKSNFNKITFTYKKPNNFNQMNTSPNYYSHQFQRNQSLNLMSTHVRAFQTIQIDQNTSDGIHINPAISKIKKPKPTIHKSYNHHKIIPINSTSSLISCPIMSNAEKRDFFGSKISRNSRQSIIDKCLPNLQNQTFSSIQEDNSQRYFDSDGELEPLVKKISLKNIEISHENGNQQTIQEDLSKNLFMDFQNSHREDRERRQTRFQSKQRTQFQPDPILQMDVEEIKCQKFNILQLIHGNFPLCLIILSGILLVIQCAS